MESIILKSNGIPGIEVLPESDSNDERNSNVPPGYVARQTANTGQHNCGGDAIICPLCPKSYKSYQSLIAHVEMKHPEPKSYSLRPNRSKCCPRTAGNNGTFRECFRRRASVKLNYRRKRIPQMLGLTLSPGPPKLTKASTSFTYSRRSPPAKAPILTEPIGNPTPCQFCHERFYGDLYLEWHAKHEHSHLKTDSDPVLTPRTTSCENPLRSRITNQIDDVKTKTDEMVQKPNDSCSKTSEDFISPSKISPEQIQCLRPLQRIFRCGRCPAIFFSHPELATHLYRHRKRLKRLLGLPLSVIPGKI